MTNRHRFRCEVPKCEGVAVTIISTAPRAPRDVAALCAEHRVQWIRERRVYGEFRL
jgi:hypothetical protein